MANPATSSAVGGGTRVFDQSSFCDGSVKIEGELIPATGGGEAAVVIIDDDTAALYNGRKGVLIQNRDADDYVLIQIQARGTAKPLAATFYTGGLDVLTTIKLKKDSDIALAIGENLQVAVWNSGAGTNAVTIASFI